LHDTAVCLCNNIHKNILLLAFDKTKKFLVCAACFNDNLLAIEFCYPGNYDSRGNGQFDNHYIAIYILFDFLLNHACHSPSLFEAAMYDRSIYSKITGPWYFFDEIPLLIIKMPKFLIDREYISEQWFSLISIDQSNKIVISGTSYLTSKTFYSYSVPFKRLVSVVVIQKYIRRYYEDIC